MPERAWIYSYDSLLRPSWLDRKIWSVPRAKHLPPKPVAEFGFRNGITIRSIVYWGAALVAVYVLRHLPYVELVTAIPPWWLAYVTVPVVAAIKLTSLSRDGRRVPSWLAATFTHYTTPCTRSGGRAVRPSGTRVIPSTLTALRSADSKRLAHGVLRGPCRVAFRERMAIEKRRGRYVALPATDGTVTDVELSAGERLEVRP